MVEFYDDLIDNEVSDEIYNYCQTISWYHKWYGLDVETNHCTRKLNEYIPAQDGNAVHRHILSQEAALHGLMQLLQFSSYRHPLGWNTQSLEERNPLIWSLWCTINDKLFQGKGDLEGIGDKVDGLRVGNHFFKDQIDFYEKYGVPRDKDRWTTYFSARASEPIGLAKVKKQYKEIHKDTCLGWYGDYYTVLYVVNRNWNPTWGGEIVFYGDDYTGDCHRKGKYDIGWPTNIIGNRQGRVIVYRHHDIHKANPPSSNADEMTQRIAFRVRVTK
jgi:hypothetical protein